MPLGHVIDVDPSRRGTKNCSWIGSSNHVEFGYYVDAHKKFDLIEGGLAADDTYMIYSYWPPDPSGSEGIDVYSYDISASRWQKLDGKLVCPHAAAEPEDDDYVITSE